MGIPLESEPAGKIKVLLEFADKQLNSNNLPSPCAAAAGV